MGVRAADPPEEVAVGHDIRLTGPELTEALCEGLVASGVEVVDIGLVGTEEVYFATFSLELDGGVMVTASHNPRDYNGLKFTRDKARPISADTGLLEIEQSVLEALRASRAGRHRPTAAGRGRSPRWTRGPSTWSICSPTSTRRSCGRSRSSSTPATAAPARSSTCSNLLCRSSSSRSTTCPTATFPTACRTPCSPRTAASPLRPCVSSGADLGIAWDGDFDRCFFFDEKGTFIEGYYLVGLLAERALKRHPGGKIVHDPRLVWNTQEMVLAAGGEPVLCKSGHAFIKEKMRAVDAVYGGEMSAHHYFKEFSYCDSGMIPWLQVAEAMSELGRPLSELVEERMARYPVSGEINLTLSDAKRGLDAIRTTYEPKALALDATDGLSFEFEQWRFNVRTSNTEPVVRVNVETRGDQRLLRGEDAGGPRRV